MRTFDGRVHHADAPRARPEQLEKLEEDVVKRIEKELGKGVTWRANYAVVGPYDYLDICEARDIEAAMKMPRYGRQPSGSGSRRSFAVCRGWRLTAVISQRPMPTTSAPMPTTSAPMTASLPPPRPTGAVSVEEALASRRSVRDFADAGLSLEDMAQLLWAAQGITHSEGLRTAPSAGALYPAEVYLVSGRLATLPVGIYRYDPRRHQLAPTALGDRLPGLAAAALHQTWIADAPAVVVIAAAFRRTSAKYGGRGERYVHIEAGHAAENDCLQAVALSLGTTIVGAFSDAEVKRLLGLGEEEPLLLIPVGKPG